MNANAARNDSSSSSGVSQVLYFHFNWGNRRDQVAVVASQLTGNFRGRPRMNPPAFRLLPSAASGIFYGMSKRLALFYALPLLVSTRAFPRSPSALPPVVQAEIKKAQSACEPKLPKLSPGFIIEGDVNGDGGKDYVLDYGAFKCGRQLFFCGTAGCLTQVFASLSDGGHVKVLDENVRNIKFRMLKGRPAMIL